MERCRIAQPSYRKLQSLGRGSIVARKRGFVMIKGAARPRKSRRIGRTPSNERRWHPGVAGRVTGRGKLLDRQGAGYGLPATSSAAGSVKASA